MGKLIPREYQTAAATALWNHVHNNPSSNPLVVIPTGAGKSLIQALWIQGMVQTYPSLRIVALSHVKEIVDANHRALKKIWPLAPTGIFSAGLGKKETHGQVTFGGVGTFVNNEKRFGRVDFLLIDEAHRVSDNKSSSYQKIIERLRYRNPNLIVIGMTATDYRMGMGKLTEGKVFDTVCFDMSEGEDFVWLVKNHYLVKLIPRRPHIQLDESSVKIRAGEYDSRSASEAFHDQNILAPAVETIIEQAKMTNRKAWLIFAQSIEDCEEIEKLFAEQGYSVKAVHSKRDDRNEVLKEFEEGRINGVVNQDILTTGYDFPGIDLIAVLRLTRSPGLWVQILGRGARPLWPEGSELSTFDGRQEAMTRSRKKDCLVLDFAGNTERLGPINYPVIPKSRRKKGGEPPARACPKCQTYMHISIRICEECGYEFPPPEKKLGNASTSELVRDFADLPPIPEKEFGVFAVDQMVARVQRAKPGKWPTLRVDYHCGLRRFSKWACPEHPGVASALTARWWREHGGNFPMPKTAAEMESKFDELNMPVHIKVWLNPPNGYTEIDGYDFVGTAFRLPPELGGETGPTPAEIRDRKRTSQDALNKEIADAGF